MGSLLLWLDGFDKLGQGGITCLGLVFLGAFIVTARYFVCRRVDFMALVLLAMFH